MPQASTVACAALALCVLAEVPARAQPREDASTFMRHEPAERPRPRGTHFLFDFSGGVAPAGDAGFAGALSFGAGGRPAGSPLRLYGLAELSFAETRPDPALHARSIERDERGYLGLAGGLRLYVPLSGALRLFFDALAGASFNRAELSTPLGSLEESDWFVQGALAGGLQYRLLHALSLGLRVKWLTSEDPLWDVREALGLSNAFPFVLSAGLTWHF